MKEFIIFVCTDSTEIFLSKLRSSCSNYNLPSFFTDSYCAGVSNKHCLLTFFIVIAVLITCTFDALILFSDGEYHFVSNEEKVSKQAPKLWKTGPGEVTFSFLGMKASLVFPLLHLADLPNSLEKYGGLIR